MSDADRLSAPATLVGWPGRKVSKRRDTRRYLTAPNDTTTQSNVTERPSSAQDNTNNQRSHRRGHRRPGRMPVGLSRSHRAYSADPLQDGEQLSRVAGRRPGRSSRSCEFRSVDDSHSSVGEQMLGLTRANE